MHHHQNGPACEGAADGDRRAAGQRWAVAGFVCGGYTLVEILVVILVLGIVSLVALLRLSGFGVQNESLAADQLRACFRYAQTLALSRERFVRIEFSVPSNTYSVSVGTNGSVGPGAPVTAYAFVSHPVRQTNWISSFGVDYPGVALQSVAVGSGSALFFNGTNGVPYNSSGPLVSNAVVTFRAGKQVMVIQGTGYVSIP